MCVQIDWVWVGCGHRCFAKFDTCAEFGTRCFGASGDHLEQHVNDICADCKVRAKTSSKRSGHDDGSRKKRKSHAH